MDLKIVWDWITLNMQYIILIVVILFILGYTQFRKWYDQRNLRLKENPFPKQAPKLAPVEIPLEENLMFSPEFKNVHYMEQDYREKLRSHLGYIREEVSKKSQDYKVLQEKYKQLLELEKRLRFHITNLKEQEKILSTQLSHLETKQKAQGVSQ